MKTFQHFRQHLRYTSNVCNELSSRVVTRMDELGVSNLTDIQEKVQLANCSGSSYSNIIIGFASCSTGTQCYNQC